MGSVLRKCVEEGYEIMSDKEFFKHALLEKSFNFQKLKKLLMLIALTSIHVERFTGCVSDWDILNNDWLNQKIVLQQY